jgi:type 2 lantibiotic biosynthesis protein LanM
MNRVHQSDAIRLALTEIAAQATPLAERLQLGFSALPTDPAVIEERYRQWQTAVGKDDPTVLERRLAWDNLTLEQVRPMLGNVAAPPGYTLPPWAEKLAEIIEIGCTHSLDSLLASVPSVQAVDPTTTDVPFLEFWLPFIHAAQTHLAGLPLAERLEAEVKLKPIQWLVNRLQRFGAETLHGAFWKARLSRRPMLALIGPAGLISQVERSQQTPGRDEYLAFVKALLADPIPLYREFSVLARMLGTLFVQWAKSVELFYGRLANDLPTLCTMLRLEGDPGPIVNLRMGISDPHHEGQVAFEVEFARGLHLIYKPHSLEAEAAYQKLLEWLNGYNSTYPDILPIQTYQVLDRADYGWGEFVQHHACQDVNALRRYYQRVGTVICLLYLLRTTDVHHENLIAAGEHPTPVDLEMILYPRIHLDLGGQDDLGLRWLNADSTQNSVFGSGLIPTMHTRNDQAGYDGSGLGDLNMPTDSTNVQVWKYINTDAMALIYEDKTFGLDQRKNMPYLENVPQSSNGFVPDLLRGFNATYTLVMERREELETRILPMFRSIPVRFVMRPTRVYFDVLLSGIAPNRMTDGVALSVHIEHLVRAYATIQARPDHWDICLEEMRVLETLNIPHFSKRADSTSLLLNRHRQADNVFLASGYQLMLDGLHRFNPFDRQRQTAYLIAALQPISDDVPMILPEVTPHQTLEEQEFVDEAVRIATLLIQGSYRVDGGLSWEYLAAQSPAHNPTNGSGMSVAHVGPGMYNGLMGIAVFLAGLWRTTGVAEHRDWALSALGIPRLLLAGKGRAWLARYGISAAEGLGALVYGLTFCGKLLDEPALIANAVEAAGEITPNLVTADFALDVIGGAGGALLSLMALYQQQPTPAILDTARRCGDHLLAALRPEPNSALRAWPTLDGRFLGGFSHGVAGIALALLRLGATSGDERYVTAAEEAIAYEDTLFSVTLENWRDLRQDEEAYMTRWCHGAPGIALARLGGLAVLDNPAIRRDLEQGLETTRRVLNTYPESVDHLCCGNFGRVDIVLEAGRRLDRADLVAQAQQVATDVVTLARQTGSYYLVKQQPRGLMNPGLFNGAAGVGYALLRIVQRDLPCILLWD